jgi:RND superfamily putative drug exporter
MRWPVPVTLVVLIILFVLGIPFLHIKLATTDINVLPANQEARVVSQKLSQDFAHQGNAQLYIFVQTRGNALTPDNLASLDRYVKSIQALPGVVAVQSLVTVSPDLKLADYQQLYAHPGLNPQITQVAATQANGNVSQMAVSLQSADHTSEATTLVKQIRALHAPGGLTALVDGTTPEEIDLLAGIETTLPTALLVIIASIFALLFLMTGSLIVPLKAIILNTISLSATFGGLVWIFQDGHFQNLLNFELLGSIDASQPVLIFAIAFGLSMDYEVFILSRIKEVFDETGNNRLAVSSGIQRTGWLVTSAALLLAVVLGGFAAATTISIQEIGIGLATAVIVDATLIRMLLLPATMRMLGTFNWWAPAPLRWLWQHIGLRETAPTPAFSPAFQVQAGKNGSGEHLPLQVPVASGHETSASQQSGTKRLSKVLLLPVGSEKQAKALGQEVH